MGYVENEILTLAKKQVGYKEDPLGSNKTKYARFFDVEAWQFFNTKKNPCYWCSVFVIWLIVQVLYPLLGKSYDACRKWLGMPIPKLNEAAGCKQFYGYLKAKGWTVAKNQGRAADIIFFNTGAGSCAHVGIIESVENGKYYTIEGNKSNQVKRCSYAINSSEIYAVVHIDYSEFDKKPEPEPLPIPTPEPIVVPTEKKYRVTGIKTFLAIRSTPVVAPNDANKVGELKNGAIVTVYEKNGGWARITGNCWVSMSYLKEV